MFETDQQKSIKAGANAFLAKPVQADNLYTLLERHMVVKWQYDDIHPDRIAAPKAINAPIVTPSPEILAKLYEDTLTGDIAALQQQLQTISQLGSEFEPFVMRVEQFVARFDIKGLQSWIESEHPRVSHS